MHHIPCWRTTLSLTALLWLSACASRNDFPPAPRVGGQTLRSGLSIPPGETFILGGDQPHGFTVRANNIGPSGVEISADPNNDGSTPTILQPGANAEAKFEQGATARLRNLSDQRTAKLNVTIWSPNNQNLGMRYTEKPD
ncbi:MAG: hypothetical protein R3C45_10055 [Phycisphaerales bacterium]